MSNNDAGLPRDALIEKVEQAWLELGYEGTDINGGLDEDGRRMRIVATLDVFAAAVADDLEAHHNKAAERMQTNGAWLGQAERSYLGGIESAAQRVRGLLGKGEINE